MVLGGVISSSVSNVGRLTDKYGGQEQPGLWIVLLE